MVFYADHVQLCGVTICGGSRCKQARKALDLLRGTRDGTSHPFSGASLAKRIGCRSGQNGATAIIRDLRKRITTALAEAGITCGNADVILSGGPGYRLHESISVSVQDGEGENGLQIQGHDRRIRDPDDPNVPDRDDPNVPDLGDPDDPNVLDRDAEGRRIWILQELAKGRRLRGPDVVRNFGCSRKTAKRDLRALKNEGQIEFVGTSRTGHYRLKEGPTPR
jgi:biotin operon repressor